MTAPASSPTPLVLYPCPHLPGKTQLTEHGCQANRGFVSAVLGGKKIRVNNRPAFKDKEMALGLKHVCVNCPGILEVNGIKSTESPAAAKATRTETPPLRKPLDPEPAPPLTPPPVGRASVPAALAPPAPPPPVALSPLPRVSPSAPPAPDPVLNIRRCKNHPDRPWHKNTGLCIECNQDRLKLSANSPGAKLPHEREKNRVLLDFNGREELLEWLKTYAADQFRTPEAQLMFMVKTRWQKLESAAPPSVLDWGS